MLWLLSVDSGQTDGVCDFFLLRISPAGKPTHPAPRITCGPLPVPVGDELRFIRFFVDQANRQQRSD